MNGLDQSMKPLTCLWASLLLACPALAAADPCQDIAKRFAQAHAAAAHAPELCFRDAECPPRSIRARDIWENSDSPQTLRDQLLEPSEWTARVTALPLPGDNIKFIRIARTVETAHCVRDTYLLRSNGKYAMVESPTLGALSADVGYCGDASVEMMSSGKDILIVLADYDAYVVHRLMSDFSLQRLCSHPRARQLK
jgi:hypothetical protein